MMNRNTKDFSRLGHELGALCAAIVCIPMFVFLGALKWYDAKYDQPRKEENITLN